MSSPDRFRHSLCRRPGLEFTAALRACKFLRLFSEGRQGGDRGLGYGHQGSLLKGGVTCLGVAACPLGGGW